MEPEPYPAAINFHVTGTRVKGRETFYASAGTIGKYQLENNQLNKIRIDYKARPGPRPDLDIVDIKVGLPCIALLANRIAK